MEPARTVAAPPVLPPRRRAGPWLTLVLATGLLLPAGACCEEKDWSLGFYGGQYYDSEPAGFSQGRANYLHQYIVALTASKTIWRAQEWPLSLEVDGMVGHQFGTATLQEFAIAPVLRWSGFPWNGVLPTSIRAGPLGYSYTTIVSPLERSEKGEGSRHLNFLMIELTFSSPRAREHEVFLRLHHRCTIYDLLNNYGANGQDFFAIGYRRFY
ncbi:MAG: hypothetical protein HYX45_04820 [Burkholderiales bacterium]|nr:hypothetical protein [Burkholderiales bacterium]